MRTQMIQAALAVLEPVLLNLEDQSAGHLNHAGSAKGGHFKLRIISKLFEGKKPLQRHQMIYQALGTLMTTDIHALSIDAKAPGE